MGEALGVLAGAAPQPDLTADDERKRLGMQGVREHTDGIVEQRPALRELAIHHMRVTEQGAQRGGEQWRVESTAEVQTALQHPNGAAELALAQVEKSETEAGVGERIQPRTSAFAAPAREALHKLKRQTTDFTDSTDALDPHP
jgi:hypothetical protein